MEDNLRQLGLQPTRRVALRTSDLAKTDLGPGSTVFVPLPVSESHYFVCKATPEGLTYELLKLLRVPMESGGGLKLAVGDRTPIDLRKLVERRNVQRTKRSLDGDVASITAKLETTSLTPTCRYQLNAKDFKDMVFYCNALVAQTMIEQQLKDRGIPYTTHFPDDSDFPTPRSRSALAGMVPYICVNASDLFKDGRAAEVASPKVFLVINDWWQGAKCSVETIVRLRHRPSVTATSEAASSTSGELSTSSIVRSDGIKFDQVTSTVRFRAPKISQCVPDFLEQWERLSKVIVVAGEITRLTKTEEFRDIRMISFDLCTAILQYAPVRRAHRCLDMLTRLGLSGRHHVHAYLRLVSRVLLSVSTDVYFSSSVVRRRWRSKSTSGDCPSPLALSQRTDNPMSATARRHGQYRQAVHAAASRNPATLGRGRRPAHCITRTLPGLGCTFSDRLSFGVGQRGSHPVRTGHVPHTRRAIFHNDRRLQT